MIIRFGNEHELKCLDVIEREELCIGSNRHVLTAMCAPDAVSLDTLNSILSETANTGMLLIEDTVIEEKVEDSELVVTEIPVEKHYEGYTIKISIGIDKVLVQPESPDSAAVYADRLVFKLGRPTFTEQQLAALGIATMQ